MLTSEQARFFGRNGFVRLPGIVPAATCAYLVERTWAALPADWRRDDPRTWRGRVRDTCHDATLDTRGGLLKFKLKELAADPAVVASFQQSSPVFGAALDLVGSPLCPIRLRGLHPITPIERPDDQPRAPSPHIEAHPTQIVAICYLEDVLPHGGGLLVWPGSHRDFYRAFDSKLDYVANDRYAVALARWRGFEPLELCGQRGDVFLVHHRMLHSPSINRSKRIRFAFLCDYTPQVYPTLCTQPPGADEWEDWPGLVRLSGGTADLGETDHPRRPARKPPLWSAVLRLARRARRAVAPAEETQATRNRSDASCLVREKRPGDVWLSVSDSPAWFHQTHSLDPKGSDLTALGVRATLNGERLVSRSRGDITVRLTVRDGGNELVLDGVTVPLWVRIVEIRLPFVESCVLVRRALEGGERRVTIVFDRACSASPAP